MSRFHILILDNQRETSHQLSFLLQLAGHRTTWVHTPAEAVNWLGMAMEFGRSFDLLLVNRFDGEFSFPRMFTEIRKQTADLLILLVERSEEAIPKSMLADERLHRCRPGNILPMVAALLRGSRVSESLQGVNHG